jgi:hypothetical protein
VAAADNKQLIADMLISRKSAIHEAKGFPNQSTWREHDWIDDGNDAALYRGELEAEKFLHHAIAHGHVWEIRAAVAGVFYSTVALDDEPHRDPTLQLGVSAEARLIANSNVFESVQDDALNHFRRKASRNVWAEGIRQGRGAPHLQVEPGDRRDDALPSPQGIEQTFVAKLYVESAAARRARLGQIRNDRWFGLGVADLEGAKVRDDGPTADAPEGAPAIAVPRKNRCTSELGGDVLIFENLQLYVLPAQAPPRNLRPCVHRQGGEH